MRLSFTQVCGALAGARVYKNGDLIFQIGGAAGVSGTGPIQIGSPTFVGTVKLFRYWEEVELGEEDAKALYVPFDRPHHEWELGGCVMTEGRVRESDEQGVVSVGSVDAVCGDEGMIVHYLPTTTISPSPTPVAAPCVDTRGSGYGAHGDDTHGTYADGVSTQCEYYKNKNECGLWGGACQKTCGQCGKISNVDLSAWQFGDASSVEIVFRARKAIVFMGQADENHYFNTSVVEDWSSNSEQAGPWRHAVVTRTEEGWRIFENGKQRKTDYGLGESEFSAGRASEAMLSTPPPLFTAPPLTRMCLRGFGCQRSWLAHSAPSGRRWRCPLLVGRRCVRSDVELFGGLAQSADDGGDR